MKQLMILLSIVLLSIHSNAQIEKNTIAIEVDIPVLSEGLVPSPGISFLANEDGYFGLVGGIADYFVIENLAIKGGFGFFFEDDGDNALIYSIGPKYFIEGKIPVSTSLVGVSAFRGNNYNYIESGIGYNFFLKDWVSIEPEMKFNYGIDVDEPFFSISSGVTLFLK